MRLIDADKKIRELEELKVPQGSDWDEMRNFAILTISDAETVEAETPSEDSLLAEFVRDECPDIEGSDLYQIWKIKRSLKNLGDSIRKAFKHEEQ